MFQHFSTSVRTSDFASDPNVPLKSLTVPMGWIVFANPQTCLGSSDGHPATPSPRHIGKMRVFNRRPLEFELASEQMALSCDGMAIE